MTALPVAGPRLPGLPPQSQASLPPQSNPGSSQPPQGVLREIPPAILCKIGQETVQDIVSRSMEIFHLMRATQLPNGVTQSHAVYQDRFHKLQEHLRQLALLFRKLRLLYEKCAETTAELGETPSELIPYLGEEAPGFQVDPCGLTAQWERQEVFKKVKQKNQEMKLLMDQMRNLLWDVNAMLTLRK
ncbi:mediator of RNA polymerase II transcription subunit 30-like [Acipenser ruthenus]|uniref:mediator of RNA polymerase II transcription subunit 30-like n=1 Tax=Acipenser ruthenus TaxID=7906 RepID=UPI0027417A46|nr:mediator of RNA polymerase II transcription subunit 30-like [Acipenser ruthenus]